MSDKELPVAPRRGRPPKEMRQETRAEIRDDVDPRERALRRAAEIREHNKTNPVAANDKFFIDPAKIPPGWDYEWKAKTVAGQPNEQHLREMKYGGWEPVPASRHPDMMPKGRYETIEREGLILMERPLEVTQEARRKEFRNARESVLIKEQQLRDSPTGTFERGAANVKRGYQPMDIPKE